MAQQEVNAGIESNHAEYKELNQWTVMVYLAGDNNLAEEMVYALKTMELVGSDPPKFEVFALYDSGTGPVTFPILKGQKGLLERAEDTRQTRAAELVRDTRDKLASAKRIAHGFQKPAEDARKRLGLTSTAGQTSVSGSSDVESEFLKIEAAARAELDLAERSYAAAVDAESNGGSEGVESVQTVLTDFVVKTIHDHPAEKYMLVLSGHGSGAVGDFLSSDSRVNGLSIPDLKSALKEIRCRLKGEWLDKRKINILGMDSCLMGMAEVAFEVQDDVDFLVGPQGFVPNTGWPYGEILELLVSNPTPWDLSRSIVETYIASYSDYMLADVSTDHAALDLRKEKTRLTAFAAALGGPEGLAMLLKEALESDKTNKTMDAVVMAHWRSQGYKNEQHTDVYDFCLQLKKRFREKHRIAKACKKVMKTVDNLVIHSDYCGPEFQHSHGISVFFPWANITDAAGVTEVAHYKKLAFADKTHWDEFLKAYHLATQREVQTTKRGGPTHFSRMNRREGLFTGPPDTRTNSPAPRIKTNSPNPRIRMSGSARFDDMPKIASMKNPPVKWQGRS